MLSGPARAGSTGDPIISASAESGRTVHAAPGALGGSSPTANLVSANTESKDRPPEVCTSGGCVPSLQRTPGCLHRSGDSLVMIENDYPDTPCGFRCDRVYR